LLLVAAAGLGCPKAAAPTDAPADADTPLRVRSTADWGCHVPPFRHEACGTEEAPGEDPRACFVLTRAAQGPWDPGVFGGALHVLDGHDSGETMTLADWYRAQGKPVPEGTCHEVAYPVFEISAWCVEATADAFTDRYAIPDADAEHAKWVDDTVARIEAHACG
jgi:hypothetical protein